MTSSTSQTLSCDDDTEDVQLPDFSVSHEPRHSPVCLSTSLSASVHLSVSEPRHFLSVFLHSPISIYVHLSVSSQ